MGQSTRRLSGLPIDLQGNVNPGHPFDRGARFELLPPKARLSQIFRHLSRHIGLTGLETPLLVPSKHRLCVQGLTQLSENRVAIRPQAPAKDVSPTPVALWILGARRMDASVFADSRRGKRPSRRAGARRGSEIEGGNRHGVPGNFGKARGTVEVCRGSRSS